MAYFWSDAETFLTQMDPALTSIIQKYTPCTLVPVENKNLFKTLVESIISQQLAAKAALCISQRFLAYYNNNPSAEAILGTKPETLRELGISPQKICYLTDLAHKTVTNQITLNLFTNMNNETIAEQLLSVKGIGPWTTNIFLIFGLARPNVFPVDDLGLRKAIQKLDNLSAIPSKDYVITRAKIWQPYRTLAAWYLWKSLENKP